MKKIVLLISAFYSFFLFAQKDNEVLFTINNEPVTVKEFKRVYEKNLGLIQDEKSKNIDNYLKLYINYKLKVQQAYNLKLDTIKSYKQELKEYKEQLIKPYLQDKKEIQKLVKQAYFRTVNEVSASHILVKFLNNKEKQLSLGLINKIKDSIISKKRSFEYYINKKRNKNDNIIAERLGYFTAFKMVYPFEDMAYKTDIGKISKPFKSKFGWHIVKVENKRKSKGAHKIAHILITGKTFNGKKKINNIYKKLQNGTSFKKLAKQYSDDEFSSKNGGEINTVFQTGDTESSFNEAMYKLSKKGDFSEPFKTQFGWHIIKLIERYPVKSFKELKPSLTKKVQKSDRAELSKKSIVKQLKSKYKIKANSTILNKLKGDKNAKLLKKEKKKVILSVSEKKFLVSDFLRFIKHRKTEEISKLFNKFKNKEIVNYYKNNLENTEPDFKYTYQEYKDGLLLFSLIEQKVWKKSKDSVGLKKFFNKNKANYNYKDLEKNKGQVMTDYQKYLENNWVASLRKNAVINLKKNKYKKFKKQYGQ